MYTISKEEAIKRANEYETVYGSKHVDGRIVALVELAYDSGHHDGWYDAKNDKCGDCGEMLPHKLGYCKARDEDYG